MLLACPLVHALTLPITDTKDLHNDHRAISYHPFPSLLPRGGVVPLKSKPKSPTDADPAGPPPPNDPKAPSTDPSGPPAHLDPINPSPKEPANANAKPWEGPVPSEAEISALCNVPAGKSFFYSGTWPKADEYATQAGMVMDVKAYPDKYVDLFSGRDGTPRSPEKRTLFSSRISRMYASKAQGEVHVMVPWEQGPDPKRFFHSDEWPILKAKMESGEVTRVIQVNPDDFTQTRVYDPSRFGLSRRAV